MRTQSHVDDPSPAMMAAGAAALLGLMLWLTPGFALVSPTSLEQDSPGILHHLLALTNTVFHEAGHWILAPFGRVLSVLGGSLFEIAIPAVCGVALWRSRSALGVAFCTWWAGAAACSVARYMADARAGRLILLGGRTGRDAPAFHDWHNLLSWAGLLPQDVVLGWMLHLLGATAMLLPMLWLARHLALALLPAAAPRTRRPRRA